MAKRIFAGRCEDCYNIDELRVYEVIRCSIRLKVELCGDCIRQRHDIEDQGTEQPPIGLLMKGVWNDIKPITFCVGTKRFIAEVKYLTGSLENAGIVRLRLDGRDQWLAAGVYGSDPIRAWFEARSFLMIFYFPNQEIIFDP